MQFFTAEDYLKIDISNNFGNDKLDWDERIEWVNANESRLMNLIDEAEEQPLFYAGVKALYQSQAGEAIGYPISLDATSSGLQILACLCHDKKAALLCNVISTGHREDAYTNIYHKLCEFIGDKDKIQRADVKRAVMTSLYSSEAIPKEVFGEKLYPAFEHIMNQEAPLAWELNKAMIALWDANAKEYNWTMPDGFEVHFEVEKKVKQIVHFDNMPFEITTIVNEPTEKGRCLCANMVHSIDGMIVREMTARCSYNKKHINYLKKILNTGVYYLEKNNDKHSYMVERLWKLYEDTGYLSARILKYLNHKNLSLVDRETIQDLISTLPEEPFDMVWVHDCAKIHPNYGNDVRLQYNLQLALIAKSNLLQYLLKQITGVDIEVIDKYPNMYQEILEAEYALC